MLYARAIPSDGQRSLDGPPEGQRSVDGRKKRLMLLETVPHLRHGQNMFWLQAPLPFVGRLLRLPSVPVDQSTCYPKSAMPSWSLTSYVSNIIALPKPFSLSALVITRLPSVSQYSDVGSPEATDIFAVGALTRI